MTPVRDALLAPDHAAAVKINRDKAGEGISAQAYALRDRILSVDAWVRTTSRVVKEVHPEVSFAHLAGQPLHTRKKTWDGAEQRRQLLAAADIDLTGFDVGHGGVAVDDVLDAAVVAWTARRVLTGDATSIPDPPEQFSDGLRAAITV